MIDRYVSIKKDEGCLHCLRCMNRCPANAFSFGRLSEGTNQYRLKDRDAFFAAANTGAGNPYRKDFQSNVRKWRDWTIRYWLEHRRHPEV